MTQPLETLRPGSALLIRGRGHLVHTSIACRDAHDAWWEHELQQDEGLWLSVEPSLVGTATSLWRREILTDGLPHDHRLRLGDAVLLRVDAGSGQYEASGDTGALGMQASGNVAYAEYRGDGQHVAYEQFGRDGPVMKGTKVEQLGPGTFRIDDRSQR